MKRDNQDLLDHMAGFVEHLFAQTGEIMPMWIMENEDGELQPIITPFDSDEGKDASAEGIKMYIQAHNTIRYGFMSEAWVLAVDKEHPDFGKMPHVKVSSHQDRREVINIHVEDKDGNSIMGFFYILRPENGPAKLSPFKQEQMDGGSIGGRFTGLFEKAS